MVGGAARQYRSNPMAPANPGRGHSVEAMSMNEEGGAAILDRIRRSMGPEIVELLLKSAEAAPLELRGWPPERMFQYLRCRLRFTQNELAQKAGLTQS